MARFVLWSNARDNGDVVAVGIDNPDLVSALKSLPWQPYIMDGASYEWDCYCVPLDRSTLEILAAESPEIWSHLLKHQEPLWLMWIRDDSGNMDITYHSDGYHQANFRSVGDLQPHLDELRILEEELE